MQVMAWPLAVPGLAVAFWMPEGNGLLLESFLLGS